MRDAEEDAELVPDDLTLERRAQSPLAASLFAPSLLLVCFFTQNVFICGTMPVPSRVRPESNIWIASGDGDLERVRVSVQASSLKGGTDKSRSEQLDPLNRN